MRSLQKIFTSACFIALGCLTVLVVSQSRGAALISPPESPTPSQRFANLQKTEAPSFRRHVIPLLARVGCSARECHGSFQGRGGFQLSLFGSEWEQDFTALTQKKGDEEQTHINAANPEKSLILLKPTLQMKHKGK